MPKTNDRRMITIGRVGVIFTYLQSPPSSAPTSRFKLSTSLLSRESPSSFFLPLLKPFVPDDDSGWTPLRATGLLWSVVARCCKTDAASERAVQFKFRDVPTTGRDGSDLLYLLRSARPSSRLLGRLVMTRPKHLTLNAESAQR